MSDVIYNLPRGYLSASSISLYQRCGMQYYYRYCENLVIPPNAALVTGKAVHKTFEEYYKAAIDGFRMTPAQADELAGFCCEEELAGEEVNMSSTECDDMKPVVAGIARRYVESIGCNITPLATEEEFRVTMPCGVDLKGFLDLRHDLGDGKQGIADYKITDKAWTMGRLTGSLQFMLYSAVTGIGDVQVHNLTKGAYKALPKKPPVDGVTKYASNMQVLHHVFDTKVEGYLDNLVGTVAVGITAGIFPYADPSQWWCTPEWCGYWGRCRGKRS